MRGAGLVLAGLALVSAPEGATAVQTLRLSSGARLTVESPVQQPLAWGQQMAVAERGIRYTLTDALGRTWIGSVPGTSDVIPGADLGIAEAQGGAAYVVYPRIHGGSSGLAAISWNGRDWTHPEALSVPVGTHDQPKLAFRESGEAILAWRWSGTHGVSYLLRHFLLAPQGEVTSYSFVRIDDAWRIMSPVNGRLGLPDGLAGVAVKPGSAAVEVVLAAAATPAAGVLRVQLSATEQGGGFIAPPVIITISTQLRDGTPSGGFGRDGNGVGTVMMPYHLDLQYGIAYYWLDGADVRLLTARDGVVGRTVTFQAPGDEAALLHARALTVARSELLRVDERLSPRDAVRRGR